MIQSYGQAKAEALHDFGKKLYDFWKLLQIQCAQNYLMKIAFAHPIPKGRPPAGRSSL